MKLFLSSIAISPQQCQAFTELVGKNKPQDITIISTENAADTYEPDKRAWVDRARNLIVANGFNYTTIDLNPYRNNPDGLRTQLEQADAVWLAGGNCFYLRVLLKETGADNIIRDLANAGKVIGGASAGAMVMGPTLRHFELVDHPEKVPNRIYDGLGLTEFVPLAHWGNEKYGGPMEEVRSRLENDGYKTVCITDAQAYTVDGVSSKLIQ